MDKAKEIFKNKVREARKPLLEAKDVEYIKALESGDNERITSVVTEKQVLRDSTADPNISSASNIQELKESWNSDLLGPNPYL